MKIDAAMKIATNEVFGKLTVRMNYHDPLKDVRSSYTQLCPLCKMRLYWPGFTHVWMIVRRSDVLKVEANFHHPILMHRDCAARWEVTKRLLISAGTISPDSPNIWDTVTDEMLRFDGTFTSKDEGMWGILPAFYLEDEEPKYNIFGKRRKW